MVDLSRVDDAIRRSQERLLGLQAPAGFWLGELEADTTITSEYLLFRHLLGTPDPDLERGGKTSVGARAIRAHHVGDAIGDGEGGGMVAQRCEGAKAFGPSVTAW